MVYAVSKARSIFNLADKNDLARGDVIILSRMEKREQNRKFWRKKTDRAEMETDTLAEMKSGEMDSEPIESGFISLDDDTNAEQQRNAGHTTDGGEDVFFNESSGTKRKKTGKRGRRERILQKSEKESAGDKPDKVIPVVEADISQGLNPEQVRERMNHGYRNDSDVSGTKTVKEIIKSNTLTYFNMVFLVLAACLIAVGSFRDLAFLLVIIANTGIGIFQEIRSKKAVDELTVLAEQKVTVIRGGEKIFIPSSSLVRDDIVEFKIGDQICADAIVRSGQITANESLLTGETDDIPKGAGAELKSGSSCTSGNCVAQLTHVGADSYVNKLTLEAKSNVKMAKSEMMRSLDRLIRVIGILLIPVGIGLFYNEYVVLHLDMKESVQSVVASLIGMIPEGLYLLTSVALAASVVRLSAKKVLVRDMNCVETLARVDTLCVDKTGTITEPDMHVEQLICLSETQYPTETVTQILSAIYQVSEAGNDTARAMAEEYKETPSWHPERIVPFSSAAKWSGVTFAPQGSYVIGAPDFMMKERFGEIAGQVTPLASDGYRVLLLAGYQGALGQGEQNITALNTGLIVPIALIAIANPIRKEAVKTFRYFARQGVTVKVISGDNPSTVSAVAKRAGIAHAEEYVDAATLQSQEQIEEAVEKYTVFGRVTPSQKKAMVMAMQKQKHTVAMTGDGVNDVLALKEADCGIAMASGSQAASQIAQLVLLNSDFQAMPGIVGEGRRVINNIQLSATLFLVKNIYSFLIALISLYKGFALPLKPLQLSTISFLTIGCPAFFLAMQPNRNRVEGHFLGNVLYRALPGGIANAFLVVLVQLFVSAFHMGQDALSTISCILVLVNGLIILFITCRPFNLFRKILWVSMTAVSAMVLFVFSGLLNIGTIGSKEGLVLAVHVMLCVPLMYATYWVEDKANAVYNQVLAAIRKGTMAED